MTSADMYFSEISITHSVYQVDHKNYFKDTSKICLKQSRLPERLFFLKFLIKIDVNLLTESVFLKTNIKSLQEKFKKM